MANATQKRLTLAEVVELPEFATCTQAQQLWLKAYFTSLDVTSRADAVSATRIAYPATSPQNLASRACHVAANKKIKAILALAFHRPMLVSVLPGLDEALKKSIAADLKTGGLTIATQRAIQFYEHQVRLARAKDAEDQTPKYAIGSLIQQDDGKTYRIEAVEVEETT
jgi:hypothetical protein